MLVFTKSSTWSLVTAPSIDAVLTWMLVASAWHALHFRFQ